MIKRAIISITRRIELLIIRAYPKRVKLILLNFFWKYKLRNIHYKNEIFRVESQDGNILEITRINRLKKLKNGVNNRLIELQREYLTSNIELDKSELVIDIGANIGEFGKYWMEKGFKVISFEPDPIEFKALKLNLSDSECYNIGLWDKASELKFYSKNASGDSSFFKTNSYDRTIKLSVFPLDYFKINNEIGLLKIEAEGAEPEILKGAEKTLAKTKYVTVDVGMERGINAESTLVEVSNILYDNNFKLVNFNPKRLVLLFKSINNKY
ncbi:MAG: FkbM family methyltransferase [Flavobacteriaceae bacterium]